MAAQDGVEADGPSIKADLEASNLAAYWYTNAGSLLGMAVVVQQNSTGATMTLSGLATKQWGTPTEVGLDEAIALAKAAGCSHLEIKGISGNTEAYKDYGFIEKYTNLTMEI